MLQRFCLANITFKVQTVIAIYQCRNKYHLINHFRTNTAPPSGANVNVITDFNLFILLKGTDGKRDILDFL